MANEQLDSARQLAGLARRLQNDPTFMAHVLAAYQQQERLSNEALVEELGTTPAMLTRLALCRKPNPTQFGDQIRQIALYTNIDAARLAHIVRQVESLQKLSKLPGIPLAKKPNAQQMQPRTGLLAAARDRDEAESNQPPEVNEDDSIEE